MSVFIVVIQSLFTGSSRVVGDPDFSLFKREISKQKEDNQTGSTFRSGDAFTFKFLFLH